MNRPDCLRGMLRPLLIILILGICLPLPMSATTEIFCKGGTLPIEGSREVSIGVGGIDQPELIAFDLSYDTSLLTAGSLRLLPPLANASIISTPGTSGIRLAILNADPGKSHLYAPAPILNVTFTSNGPEGVSSVYLTKSAWSKQFRLLYFDRVENCTIGVYDPASGEPESFEKILHPTENPPVRTPHPPVELPFTILPTPRGPTPDLPLPSPAEAASTTPRANPWIFTGFIALVVATGFLLKRERR